MLGAGRLGYIFYNGVEERLEVRARHVGGVGRDALAGGTEQHGGVQLLRGGVQVQHLQGCSKIKEIRI